MSKARSDAQHRIDTLLRAIGFEPRSFERLLEWVLDEEIVALMAADPVVSQAGFFEKPDALKRFRDQLNHRTSRRWSHSDLEVLFGRVKERLSKHDRKPISAEEYLKLLWQVPFECVKCGRHPPAIALHVDHIFPASKGGQSKRPNLQFLCAEHNLMKSDKLEVTDPWLSLQ